MALDEFELKNKKEVFKLDPNAQVHQNVLLALLDSTFSKSTVGHNLKSLIWEGKVGITEIEARITKNLFYNLEDFTDILNKKYVGPTSTKIGEEIATNIVTMDILNMNMTIEDIFKLINNAYWKMHTSMQKQGFWSYTVKNYDEENKTLEMVVKWPYNTNLHKWIFKELLLKAGKTVDYFKWIQETSNKNGIIEYKITWK